MPAPAPKIAKALSYLRHEFPYKEDFRSHDGTVYPYEQVKAAVYSLRDNSPEILKILNYHMYTNLPRTRIAEEVGYDPSTIKRKLDQAANCMMQRLVHGDFPPGDLFTNRNPVTGVMEKSAFPVTFPGVVHAPERDKDEVYKEDLEAMRKHAEKLKKEVE